MERPLLRTRLTVPPPPRRLVRRDRLLDALEREVPAHRLTLVSAPAGYGKTTLVAGWARESQLPVAWLSADPADTTPERFLRHLFAAWSTVHPRLETTPAGVLMSGRAPDIDAVLAGLANAASECALDLALVIDDCDVITSASILDAIAWLLDHLPPTVHLVLTGRAEPALPLARYRARQAVFDIDATDLRLTPAECRSMLRDDGEPRLATADIDRLNERLEGWAAGVQLAAVGLRRDRGSIPDVAMSGRQRFIADYLRDEVLGRVSGEARRFLLVTSIVDRMTGSLCDALTGTDGGEATLETFERQNLFTMALDPERTWYRYHGLMTEFLRDQLARELPAELEELHRRAGRWYLDRELPDLALRHAVAASDLPLAFDVLDRHGMSQIHTGQFSTLRAWLGALPAPWYEAQPELVLIRVALLVFTGQFEAGMRLLDTVEEAIASAAAPSERAMGRATAVRCFIACEANEIEQAEHFAEKALGHLPAWDDEFRAGVWGALGDVYRRNGRWRDAHANYLRSLSHVNTPGSRILSAQVYGGLADLELRQGHLRRADGYWRNAMALIEDERLWGAYPLPLVGWVSIRHGEILYERNDLAGARKASAFGWARAELGGDPRAILAGILLAERLHLADGDPDAAEAALERARAVIADAWLPEWRAELERCQVELWLAQGRFRDAAAWADEALGREPDALPDQEPVSLAIARVLIASGDAASSDQAMRLLAPLIGQGEAEHRAGLRIAALALRALALAGRGDMARALASLEPALRVAEPEGYARSFIDLGLPMARLLQEAAGRGVMPEYVRTLLDGFGDLPLAPGRTKSPLPEPLSDRELQVLRSVAAGLTNREIADALFISPETVKKHTGSIYGKLGVRGRTGAVARAREFALLD